MNHTLYSTDKISELSHVACFHVVDAGEKETVFFKRKFIFLGILLYIASQFFTKKNIQILLTM